MQRVLRSSENLLLAMITDHRPHIRELGLRRVMKATAAHHIGQIRRFKVPAELNFNAVEYFDMIDWAVCSISEPPVLKAMTDAELNVIALSTGGSRHAKTELGTFTRCSSSLDTSTLSTRRLLTQSFTATRTSLTGESVLGHDDGLSTTHARLGRAAHHSGQIRWFKVRR